MQMPHPSDSAPADLPFRYLERVTPIVFPESADVPESKLHLRLRTALYQLLEHALPEATVGSDQFMYWDAEDPKRCLAPDVYVRLTPETDMARSWKVWERGAPEVAVEVISENDTGAAAWEEKLRGYRQMGVRELIRFDPEDPERMLRIWDRVEGSLRERALDESPVRSSVLDFHWVVAPLDGLAVALRIASGPLGETLVLTQGEALRVEAESRRQEVEARRGEEQARRTAEQARREEERARRTAEQARREEERARREEERARRAAEQAHRVEAEARRAAEEAHASAEKRIRELEQELKRRGG